MKKSTFVKYALQVFLRDYILYYPWILILRIACIFLKYKKIKIGKVQFIGSPDFISCCISFSKYLLEVDSALHEAIFSIRSHKFIQFERPFRAPYYQCPVRGEYGIGPTYFSRGEKGVGAMMIYGYFLSEAIGKSYLSDLKYMSNIVENSNRVKLNTRRWIDAHNFPESLVNLFENKVKHDE